METDKACLNSCPYCGSHQIDVYPMISIKCNLQKDHLCLDASYLANPQKTLCKNLEDTNYKEAVAQCKNCGEWFDVAGEDENGVWFIRNKMEREAIKETEKKNRGIIVIVGLNPSKRREWDGKIPCRNGSSHFDFFPESELTPSEQLLMAEYLYTAWGKDIETEVIVTNSPYLIEAIEVYAFKYKMSDKVKYLLHKEDAEEDDDELLYDNFFTDCTGRMEEIYNELFKPFRKLEKLRLELKMDAMD